MNVAIETPKINEQLHAVKTGDGAAFMANQASDRPSATRAPPRPSKKQELHQKLTQQRQSQEPWLFQSVHILQNPWGAKSLPLLPSYAAESEIASPAQFYLNVESLRTLLPPRGRRNRPRSSEDRPTLEETCGSPRVRAQRSQRHFPARLEALSTTAKKQGRDPSPPVDAPDHRNRRRRRRAKSARPSSAHHRIAQRVSAIKARQGHADHTRVQPRKKALGHSRCMHHGRIGMQRIGDGSDEAAARAFTPPPSLEEMEEARRQRETIASQLGLSLEEYEALDEAFGGKSDENEGSMTDRYHAVFAQYDVDGSGAISPVELRSLLKAAGEDMDDIELAKVIQQADTDGDGEINFDEFMDLMRARKRLLLVAKTMGVSGKGPTSLELSTNSKSSSHATLSSVGGSKTLSPLPPLRLAASQSKRHLAQSQFNRNFSRPTPNCLRPGAQVDVAQLRRELAIAEFGIQELNSKVRDGVQWVQQHCPVTSLKAQIYCHRWGMEKVQQLLMRLQSQSLSRAYQKWKAFLVYERNKVKANLFLKCKGSQKMTEIMAKWKRKTLHRRFAKWRSECTIEARNEIHAASAELQRVWRAKLARMLRHRIRQGLAATTIQSLVRGHLGRCRVRRLRRAQLEHDCACILQRCYRGYSGKRLAKALFKAQRESLAARRIQRSFRNHQKCRLLRAIQRTKLEHESAVRLQCCMRSFLARKERRARLLQRRRMHSSIVIQRHARGLLARREVLERKRRIAAALMIQTRYRAYRSRWQFFKMRSEKSEREKNRRERDAATTIQSQWRSVHAQRAYRYQKTQLREAEKLLAFRRLTGALRIQCLFRGYCARRRAQRLRYEKLKWMNLTLMNRCALRIQACWRGYHGRLASQLRLQARRALEHEENEAAKRIQSVARGKLARSELERRAGQRARVMAVQHQRARSALKIQKIFRGKRAREVAVRLKQEHADKARAALDRLVWQTKTRAAIKIQCCARQYLARERYKKRKREVERKRVESEIRAKREQAAVVIQCAMRRSKARWRLKQRRREFEKRISIMASEKAYDEIERLREEQEAELTKLRMQLLFQESKANEENAMIRKQLEAKLEEEKERRDAEAQELAKLKLEAIMQLHMQASDRKFIEIQRQQDSEKLREQLEKQFREKQEMEDFVRTQENEELAKLKVTTLLQTTSFTSNPSKARDADATQLEHDTVELEKAAQALQREQAKLKIQSVCLKYIAKRRIQKLHDEQAAALAQLRSNEERLRVKALQEKEMALAKLKAIMDDEARVREQEIKAMEAQMLERARLEKERIAKRNAAARRIQASARGYLGRQRVKAIQRKIERDRQERAKALEDQLAAAEAKVAEAMVGSSETTNDAEATSGELSRAGNPDDWVEYWDENAQASYFYNIKTQEASWTRPFSANPSTKAMEIATAAADYDPAAYTSSFISSNPADANAYSSAGYADEYGFYDQYGQYHYYEDSSTGGVAGASSFGTGSRSTSMQAAMAAGMMYPGYAAAAAAYAYQAAMAFGGNPMMFGATSMPFTPQAPNPLVLGMGHSNSTSLTGSSVGPGAIGYTPMEDTASPPDPWEKFFDQYTGAAYYYNSITGEKYWA